MNYKILVQYDGTRYEGWQRQERTGSTIQGKIEAVLSKMCGEEVQIQGAGRTDAGVHAKGQVANVHLKERVDPQGQRQYSRNHRRELQKTQGRRNRDLHSVPRNVSQAEL